MIADLTLRPGFVLEAEGESVPDNGVNTFAIGISRDYVRIDDALRITVDPQGPSVTNWSYVPGSLDLSVDPPRISMNFTQVGADPVRLVIEYRHSATR